MDIKAMDQLLGQLRSTAAMAENRQAEAGSLGGATSGAVDFSQVLKQSIDNVSQTQSAAKGMAEKFSAGDPNANLHEVMVDLQKASLSFQEMVQVRNKLVTAYNDIMNMPV